MQIKPDGFVKLLTLFIHFKQYYYWSKTIVIEAIRFWGAFTFLNTLLDSAVVNPNNVDRGVLFEVLERIHKMAPANYK